MQPLITVGSIDPKEAQQGISNNESLYDKINEILKREDSHANVNVSRKSRYEEAYALLQQQTSFLSEELRPLFYQVLFLYAKDLCYAQTKDDTGFTHSARLLEISFLLQLNDLGLIDPYSFEWFKNENFDQLLQALCLNAHFEQTVASIQKIDLDVLSTKLIEYPQRALFIETLIKLAYSYQNIEIYRTPVESNIALHERLNLLDIKATENDRESRIDFLYNRCSFLVGLKYSSLLPLDRAQKMLESYEPILGYLQNDNSAFSLSTKSKVENMLGLIKIRNPGLDSNPNIIAHFTRALEFREQIEEPSDKEEKFQYCYFLNNVRTGYIHALLNLTLECTEETIALIKKHSLEMAGFILSNANEGRSHSYFASYNSTLQKVLDCKILERSDAEFLQKAIDSTIQSL